MPRYTLTVLDATGIQSYIFGSNRLRENIGASQLVELATHEWVQASLPEPHNLDANGQVVESWRLEDDESRQAEVILRGGGNVLILFRMLGIAKEAVGKLSRKLLEHAPGLEIAVAHLEFEWDREALGGENGVHSQLMAKLNRTKQQRRISTPLLGQAVTLECRATGLPAITFDPARRPGESPYPLSADALAKVSKDVRDAARKRFENILPPEAKEPNFALSDDFDDFGRSQDESSYVAVVHADGNRMGKRFQDLDERFPALKDNRNYLDALRGLSKAVDQAGRTALQEAVKRMVDGFRSNASQEMQNFLSSLKEYQGKRVLPFRPIVFGGDDITFVCDGRLGLSLASIYLDEWEKATATDATIKPAYACAGVAIVKTHYPFARAYALCKDLCDQAKATVKKQRGDASALDWHFALTGIAGTISEIREREYQPTIEGKPKPLVMRPVALHEPGLEENWRTWKTFTHLVEEFKSNRVAGRNKVKELREVLRSGPEATRRFLHTYGLSEKMPEIDASKPQLRMSGWDNRCGYFDAIEAIDFYLPLA